MPLGISLALVLVSAASTAGASGSPPPRLAAVRTPQAPVVDGALEEAAWDRAPSADQFTQKFPDEGEPATERTAVRVLYDDRALYVGIRCDQRSAKLVRRLTRRDREVEADRVSVAVSSRGDGHSGYRFDVTADGVVADGIYYDDDEFTREWDENWEAATAITDDGWSVEMRIPLRILRFDARPVQDWGFNVKRYITARQEIAEWSYVPRTEAGVVSRLGRLEHLEGLAPTGGLELRPFVLGRTTHADAGYGPTTGISGAVSAGLDAKWHPTADLTLDAAFNPDFGQVEADQIVFNLSTYEVEYPEKRPFFLEGADVFATPATVLYTRRIGRLPPTPPRESGERLATDVAPSPIWGALKLVGRLGPRLSIGTLAALTGPNEVAIVGPAGPVRTATADPAALYGVLRLKRDFASRGHVGVIATQTSRLEAPGTGPLEPESGRMRCPGGRTTLAGQRCFGDATVLGVDGRWRSGGGFYAASGQALLSALRNGPPRPQRDGTVIDPGSLGVLATANLAKIGGEHWLWELEGDFVGRKVDITDLGYLERQNRVSVQAGVAFRTTRPWWRTIQTETDLDVSHEVNLDGLLLGRAVSFGSEWTLPGLWQVGLRAEYQPARFEDREVGDGTALERPGYARVSFELETDPRAPVMAQAEGSTRFFSGGGVGHHIEGGVTLRIVPPLDVDLELEITSRSGEPRYVDRTAGPEGVRTLFANLRALAVSPLARMTWTFTPRLTMQAYAQVFLASRRYDQYREHTSYAPRPRVRLRDLSPTAAPPEGERPDEGEAALNVTLLLRWEYRLGSTLHLVYTRAQAPDGLLPGRGLDPWSLRRAPATQALMLKLAHWWG